VHEALDWLPTFSPTAYDDELNAKPALYFQRRILLATTWS